MKRKREGTNEDECLERNLLNPDETEASEIVKHDMNTCGFTSTADVILYNMKTCMFPQMILLVMVRPLIMMIRLLMT